ncbi:CCNI [Bugula neritina]|nr:CCNI [Bugula neritina]
MMGEALHKEKCMWKPLELDGSSTKNGFSVTYEHRADIIQWLSDVSQQFQFYPEALALAVSLLDKFLCSVKVQLRYLKCVA